MPIERLFPTQIYRSRLSPAAFRALNGRLRKECLALANEDLAGQRWSQSNYPGGFTSYASANHMQVNSPSFARLEALLDQEVRRFVKALQLDLPAKALRMTDCWVNLMPPGVQHSLHLHPLSVISGTYYVQTPQGSPGLKLEDPRLDRFMGAPPRKARARPENRSWVSLPVAAGQLVLFESWLRHEVPRHLGRGTRISISFNYGWA